MKFSTDPNTHAEGCAFRKALVTSAGVACEHGFDVCPYCDPCGCGTAPALQLTAVGPKVQAVQHHHSADGVPAQVRGRHLWIVVSMHGVQPRPKGEYHLDTENLLTIEGPGCYWCEQPWSPELMNRSCRGAR